MVRKKVELVGEKIGVVEIVNERKVKGNRKLSIKCGMCGAEKEIWYSQYSTGSWTLCVHDSL